MKNTKYQFSFVASALSVFIITGLLFSQLALAQGGGGNGSGGSGGGSGDQTQDRIQDPLINDGDEPIQDRDQDKLQDQDRDQTQDRIQDPLINDGSEPIQDRTQDRDQLRDPSLSIGDEPIQDRDQLRDKLRDQLEDPDQDRDRDRIHVNDYDGLREVIDVSVEASDEIINSLEAEVRELAHNRNRVDVGVMALMASQNMIGQNGGQVSDLAQEIHVAHRAMMEEEEQVQNRSRLARFFFGGDDESAAAIQTQLLQNHQRVQQVNQFLDDCDCEEGVRTLLEEQVQNIEQEHARLRQLVDDENDSNGLFGFLFGWL